MKKEEEKKGETLTNYITRLETLGGTERIRVPPEYVDEDGNIIAMPVIIYHTSSVGLPTTLYDEDHTFTSVAATVAAEATLQPTAPKIFYLYGIWVVQSATAAGRDWQPMITDGTNEMPLCPATNVASGATAQLWPYKAADDACACLPPFPISNAYYLQLQDAMAAAESATVWIAYVHRSSEL